MFQVLSGVEKGTVSMHFVVAAVESLPETARQRVLDKAGIPLELLSAPNARVPADSFAALWLAIAHEIDDEFFGLDRRRMKVGSFALLCQAVLHTGTLDHAVRRILRGFAIFLDDVSGDLAVQDHQAILTISNRIADPVARRFANETFLVGVLGLMCWLTGKRIPLLSAEFSHPRPPAASEYPVMFCERLRFDAEFTAVRFDARLLNAPVVQDAASLKQFLRAAPQSVFLKYKNEESWTARLRRRLRGSLGEEEWPLLDAIAHEFHVAPKTLRRRLEAEGTSYQDIKDELRRDAAIYHLCTTTMSIADIGSLLGFREPSAFYRAFKKWSGVQPGEYRLRQMQFPVERGDPGPR